MNRKPHLLQVVDALCAAGGLASGLNSRQQQGDQDRDDGNDHRKFNKREAFSVFVTENAAGQERPLSEMRLGAVTSGKAMSQSLFCG